MAKEESTFTHMAFPIAKSSPYEEVMTREYVDLDQVEDDVYIALHLVLL